jgi:hypothetical protein
MAGKIVADTLEHSTAGSIATNYVVNGSAKAWCGASATDGSGISDSLNVSSQTDNGTGDYDYTVTSAFSAQMDNGGMTGMAGQASRIIRIGGSDTTTTLFDSKTHTTSTNALVDTSHHWAVHGDLS